MSELVLRAASPDDDQAIAAGIGEAFPGNPKARLEVLRWQYRQNPFGESVGWVWEDAGEVVAHYAAFPMPYLLAGEAAVVGNAVDAAIAPSHQGRRLFTPLAEALYEDCRRRGMATVVCYASNRVAMQGVARAGVRWMPRLRTAVLALDDEWLGRRFHLPAAAGRVVRRIGFGLGSGPVGEEVDGPPEGIDALWQRTVARDDVANGVDRGAAWWAWRYRDAPLGPYRSIAVHRLGRLVGAAVVAVREDFGGRFGYLLELLADDTEAARALLRGAAGIEGLSGLATVAVDGGPLHLLARAAGMRTLPKQLEPKGGAWYGVLSSPELDPTTRDWHVGWGDMDHL